MPVLPWHGAPRLRGAPRRRIFLLFGSSHLDLVSLCICDGGERGGSHAWSGSGMVATGGRGMGNHGGNRREGPPSYSGPGNINM